MIIFIAVWKIGKTNRYSCKKQNGYPSVCSIQGFSCLLVLAVLVNQNSFHSCRTVFINMFIILYTFMRRGKMRGRRKETRNRKNKRGNRRAGKIAQQLSALVAFS